MWFSNTETAILRNNQTDIQAIYNLLRETREQYVVEISIIRSNQEVCLENQRSIQRIQETISIITNKIENHDRWIADEMERRRERQNALRKNSYDLAFKFLAGSLVLIFGFTMAGVMTRLTSTISQQQQTQKEVIEKIDRLEHGTPP